MKMKQRLVQEAMKILQQTKDENDLLKDAAMVIVGDPNLSTQFAQQCCQAEQGDATTDSVHTPRWN